MGGGQVEHGGTVGVEVVLLIVKVCLHFTAPCFSDATRELIGSKSFCGFSLVSLGSWHHLLQHGGHFLQASTAFC